MVLIGLGLALVCAATNQVGFLLRHRGAVEAPDVDARRPLRSIAGLFRSRWWTIGYLVAAVAYALHVAALATAPLSLVQAVLAAGLVLLAVLAERFFGFSLGRREWTGVALAAVGLTFLAVSGSADSTKDSADYSVVGLVACETAFAALGAVMILSARGSDRGEREERSGIYLAIAAGLLFTVSHISLKALSGSTHGGVLGALATPFPYLIVACGVTAFFVSARSLQLGDGVAVIAVTSIAGNASALPAGVLVFGDPLGSDFLTVALRTVAFVLVVAAAALIPAPQRAGEAARAAGREGAAPTGEPATV
jgi:drug/metabolite transporter (DMT)-like permease